MTVDRNYVLSLDRNYVNHLIEFQLIEIVFYHLIEFHLTLLETFDQLIRSSEIRSSDHFPKG
jgi:hypothetical protein